MVQHAIDVVNEEGQYQAIQYLFEMIGLYPASADDDSVTEDSLARTLLLHLGLPESARQSRAQEGREFTTSDPLK